MPWQVKNGENIKTETSQLHKNAHMIDVVRKYKRLFYMFISHSWCLVQRNEACYDLGSPGCLRSLLHRTSESSGIKHVRPYRPLKVAYTSLTRQPAVCVLRDNKEALDFNETKKRRGMLNSETTFIYWTEHKNAKRNVLIFTNICAG